MRDQFDSWCGKATHDCAPRRCDAKTKEVGRDANWPLTSIWQTSDAVITTLSIHANQKAKAIYSGSHISSLAVYNPNQHPRLSLTFSRAISQLLTRRLVRLAQLSIQSHKCDSDGRRSLLCLPLLDLPLRMKKRRLRTLKRQGFLAETQPQIQVQSN